MSEAPPRGKEQALAEIRRLIEAHGLDEGDLRGLFPTQPTGSARFQSRRPAIGQIVLRVFYYLGATFVFAGLGIYINTVWSDLSSAQRVLVTLGPGFAAYLLGIAFARSREFEQAATPAHILAFILQPVGIGVLLDEYFDGNNPSLGAMIIFGPLAVQQLLTFVALRRASLLLFSLLFVYGFIGAATVYFQFDYGLSALACGLFLYLLSVDLHSRESYSELTPLLFTLGSGLMLAGLSYHVGGTTYELLSLSLSFVFLAHAVVSGSRTLYVVSLLYLASYYFNGFGGWWVGWGSFQRRQYELTAIAAGTSLTLAGHWLRSAPVLAASPVWMFFGTGFALGGVYGMVYDTAGAPVFAAVATLAIYAALALRSRAMLAAAILCLLGFMIDYAQRHFAQSLSWPLLLIAFGFVVLLAGYVFARLSGRIRESAPQSV